jgi:tRNA/tmRNA/rRNA uracil-C5-methylase (TrmA/RlmC/RlmD family)
VKIITPGPFKCQEETELRIVALMNIGIDVSRAKNWDGVIGSARIGHLARLRICENHAKYLEGNLKVGREPLDVRLESICSPFGTFSDCQYQHLADPISLEMKWEHARQVILHGGGGDADVSKCIHSELIYRSTISRHFQRLKLRGDCPIACLANGCSPKVVDVE